MPMPDGFSELSPIPWKHEVVDQYPLDPNDKEDDGFRGDKVNRVAHSGWKDGRFESNVCDDTQFYPTAVRPEDMPIIAAAPDYALLLAAIVRGIAGYYSGNKCIKLEQPGWLPRYYKVELDSFECPVLTKECRSDIISALKDTK